MSMMYEGYCISLLFCFYFLLAVLPSTCTITQPQPTAYKRIPMRSVYERPFRESRSYHEITVNALVRLQGKNQEETAKNSIKGLIPALEHNLEVVKETPPLPEEEETVPELRLAEAGAVWEGLALLADIVTLMPTRYMDDLRANISALTVVREAYVFSLRSEFFDEDTLKLVQKMGEELGLTEPNSSDENTINEIEAAAEIYATASMKIPSDGRKRVKRERNRRPVKG